jgi:hypothetical protein
MSFKANVGEKESLMRLIGGAVVLALAFLGSGFIQFILVVAALILIGTGIVRWCPVYHQMKKSTAEK